MGELIRRIVAESMEQLDDERLAMVSVTGVDVDRDMHRAVVWFTSLGDTEDGDLEIAEAFEEHARHLRRAVGDQTRLRRTPEMVFRPDTVLRSAERIERLLDEMAVDPDPDN
ncbi:MAG: 30S ribosome-binding factor RbfA [Acidimicrobiia bacterium]|nr:30S ribosome-binding factor RbfA [Acidimicrobiia bacterium]